jgi:hypothetical protein
MCVPLVRMHHLRYCGCGCAGFLEVEEEVKMLENYKRRLEDEIEIVGTSS